MHNFNLFNIPLYNLVFYFFIYSLLGWFVEVAYAFKNQKKFVNRGFLNGPLCPIYGTCLLSIVLLLTNYKGNILGLFCLATLLTSTIEYFTGFILEKLFKRKYWDYTEDPLNLHGRICLHFSIMWGIISVMIVRFIHPIISTLIDSIPITLGVIIIYTLLSLLLFDFYSTLTSLTNLKKINFYLQLDVGAIASKYTTFLQSPKNSDLTKNLEEKLNVLKSILFKNKK